jgi:hypothetical protein
MVDSSKTASSVPWGRLHAAEKRSRKRPGTSGCRWTRMSASPSVHVRQNR